MFSDNTSSDSFEFRKIISDRHHDAMFCMIMNNRCQLAYSRYSIIHIDVTRTTDFNAGCLKKEVGNLHAHPGIIGSPNNTNVNDSGGIPRRDTIIVYRVLFTVDIICSEGNNQNAE